MSPTTVGQKKTLGVRRRVRGRCGIRGINERSRREGDPVGGGNAEPVDVRSRSLPQLPWAWHGTQHSNRRAGGPPRARRVRGALAEEDRPCGHPPHPVMQDAGGSPPGTAGHRPRRAGPGTEMKCLAATCRRGAFSNSIPWRGFLDTRPYAVVFRRGPRATPRALRCRSTGCENGEGL